MPGLGSSFLEDGYDVLQGLRGPARAKSSFSNWQVAGFQPIWPATKTCRPWTDDAVRVADRGGPAFGLKDLDSSSCSREAEALELAGHGARQALHELDPARVLVGRDLGSSRSPAAP